MTGARANSGAQRHLPATDPLRWFRRAARCAALLALVVVVVGAWVRLTDAGLGCPDWPGCYGQLHPAQVADIASINAASPHKPFDYAKALHEMVHRYIATLLGALILGLAVYAWRHRRDPAQPRVLPWMVLAIVIGQGVFGALTVLWKVKPIIVTIHLLGGLTTLSLLWWLSLPAEQRAMAAPERALRRWWLAGFAMLVLQLFLGGWTSTNYAAVACPDLPTCQGSWWPERNYREAFVLWRGLGIDYEGGVLSSPARTAIHHTHRVGAVLVAAMLWLLAGLAWRRGKTPAVRLAAAGVAAAVCLQWLIGANLILQGFPLWLGTSHNAGAAVLLLSMVTLARYLWPRAGSSV